MPNKTPFSIDFDRIEVHNKGKDINNPENLFPILDDMIDETIAKHANGITILYLFTSTSSTLLRYIAVPKADAMSNHPERSAGPITEIKSLFMHVDITANKQAE